MWHIHYIIVRKALDMKKNFFTLQSSKIITVVISKQFASVCRSIHHRHIRGYLAKTFCHPEVTDPPPSPSSIHELHALLSQVYLHNVTAPLFNCCEKILSYCICTVKAKVYPSGQKNILFKYVNNYHMIS